jgi:hypothetical protein
MVKAVDELVRSTNSVTDERATAIILKPSPLEKVPRNEADEVFAA